MNREQILALNANIERYVAVTPTGPTSTHDETMFGIELLGAAAVTRAQLDAAGLAPEDVPHLTVVEGKEATP